MSLRNQVPEQLATYEDPVLGINLRASEEDLIVRLRGVRGGEARLMQNMIYDGGTRSRFGSSRITPVQIAATRRVRGGHKFYFGGVNPTSRRLIAYSNNISHISDGGNETVLTSGMTNDLDTHFNTWSITDKVYIGNITDTLRSWDGTTFATVSGTNIPVARTGTINVLDRMMCITANGIERTNPRVDNVWSSNSAWATFRPARPGLFTAIHPFNVRGADTFYHGAIALQAQGYYVITGTNYGDDVTSITRPVEEDSAILLLDPNVGTSSPYSVATVPGVGIFWFTSDLNVYLLPEGSLVGGYVGDKLQSHVSTLGIESTNTAALGQVWMTYFDRYLMLGIPMGSDTFSSVQFWLDVRSMIQHPERGPVWYGPMVGQFLSRCWSETQNGEFRLSGGEGNPSTGVFVYSLRVPARFTDAVGAVDNNISCIYQTPFADFGAASRLKYVRAINLDLQLATASTPTVSVYDLDGLVESGLTVEAVV